MERVYSVAVMLSLMDTAGVISDYLIRGCFYRQGTVIKTEVTRKTGKKGWLR